MEGERNDPRSPEGSDQKPTAPTEPPPPFRPLTHLIVDMEGGRSEDQRTATLKRR